MGRPLDPKNDHRISLEAAAAHLRRFREDGPHRPGDSGAFNATPVLRLLSQPGCVGLRFYRGRDEQGSSVLVLVGVDGDGNNMSSGEILDGHFPCPPFCPDTDDLSG